MSLQVPCSSLIILQGRDGGGIPFPSSLCHGVVSLKAIFVAVETKNCLDNITSKDSSLDRFIKPPANLVVLEGECLDSSGDGGELESYLVLILLMYNVSLYKIVWL